MKPTPLRRLWLLPAVVAAGAVALAVLSFAPGTTSGQTQPSPTATATAAVATASIVSAAPQLDDEAAVRMLLPVSIRDSERLPVHKWARADMPNAPGGYLVFIATVYPIYDGQGGSSEWLLTNYLQWNGTQWVPGIADYPGRQLTSADDLWLARNLTDITAVPAPSDQDWKVFTVAYTADGLVSPTLARSETVVEIYDLTLTTVWSRTDYLRETDTGNAGYVEKRAEDVDWVFQDIDNDGLFELIATVKDSDEIILTGDSSSANLPAPGVTNTTSTEIYKWIDGVYVLQRQAPAASTAATAAPAPTRTATAVAPAVQGTATSSAAPRPAASPTPARGPSG